MTGLYFEDLSIGQSATLTRTVDEAAIQAFADVSGDHNPVHLDEAFAATTPFKTRIAHGMLSAAYI
ncbi:MAG: MaoC/PaaZ C-terminal domain-containing protein, partial [Pseudomonadota bacterium]